MRNYENAILIPAFRIKINSIRLYCIFHSTQEKISHSVQHLAEWRKYNLPLLSMETDFVKQIQNKKNPKPTNHTSNTIAHLKANSTTSSLHYGSHHLPKQGNDILIFFPKWTQVSTNLTFRAIPCPKPKGLEQLISSVSSRIPNWDIYPYRYFDINMHRLLNHMKQKPGVYQDYPFLKGQKYELVTRILGQGGTDHQNQHCHTQVQSIFNVSCNTSYTVNLRKSIISKISRRLQLWMLKMLLV